MCSPMRTRIGPLVSVSRGERCGDCALGSGKGDEEGIALRIDLDASSCCESFAE